MYTVLMFFTSFLSPLTPPPSTPPFHWKLQKIREKVGFALAWVTRLGFLDHLVPGPKQLLILICFRTPGGAIVGTQRYLSKQFQLIFVFAPPTTYSRYKTILKHVETRSQDNELRQYIETSYENNALVQYIRVLGHDVKTRYEDNGLRQDINTSVFNIHIGGWRITRYSMFMKTPVVS